MADDLVARGSTRDVQNAQKQTQGYEPARLRRAACLKVERISDTQFRVKGSNEPEYFVDLMGDPPCYCKDQEYRGRGCKHELAARLHSGDGTLIQSLGEMLFTALQHQEK